MALQKQTLPINFGQGVDSKTDPKLVVAGKLLRLENAVFTKAKRVQKRNGYTSLSRNILGGGTLVAPRMVKSYKDELVCEDQGHLYAYSPTESAWVDKGKWTPVSTRSGVISRASSYNNLFTSGALIGNLSAYVWDVNGIPYYAVQDVQTGTFLAADKQIYGSAPGVGTGTKSFPKVCPIAGTAFGFFAINPSSALTYTPVTISAGGGVVLGTPATITATPGNCTNSTSGWNYNIGGFTTAIRPVYAVAGTSGGAVVAYAPSATTALAAASNNLNLVTIDATGAVVNSTTLAVGGIISNLHINVEASTGRIWVYYTAGASTFKYTVYDSALSVVLAPTTIAGVNHGAQGLTAISTGAGTQKVVYNTASNSQSASLLNPIPGAALVAENVTVGGTVTFLAQYNWTLMILASEIFSVGGKYYVALNNYSNAQPGLFIVDVSDGTVVAKAYAGKASDYRSGGYLASVLPLSSTKVQITCGATDELVAVTSSLLVSGGLQRIIGASTATLDFSDSDRHQSVVANDTLVLNGSQPAMYDGNSVTELGFNLYPEITGATVSTTGGSMADGTYQYFAVYRWTDANGNLYESSPSPAATLSMSGGTGVSKVTLNFSYLNLTQKKSPRSNVEIRIYRTSASGTIAHDINPYQGNTALSPIPNDPASGIGSFVDTNSDANIAGNNTLYTNGGVVENIAPAPFMAMTLHNNRLWVIDTENPNTVWYTKTLSPGTGISFSDLLTAQIDSVGGKCVGLAHMDDKLIVLGEKLPLLLSGDGANDAGVGSTLGQAVPIPSDVGASYSKGIISFPGGVLFKSPKGIYMLDRALGVKYWGLEVEAYNSQNIVSSKIVPDTTQIRFLTDSGLTLVYDYVFNQWSTFTNHQGYSADEWQGRYVYVRTDGKIFQETNSYLDDTSAYGVLIQLAWLALSGVQGFQRVWKFGLLGDFVNGGSASHGVRVSAAYDFGTVFSTPVSYLFGIAAASGVFEYLEALPQQKCGAITLLIEEVTTGDAAEFVSFTDMSFEAGMKPGINRMPGTKRVG
jgi:hypothetical protein